MDHNLGFPISSLQEEWMIFTNKNEVPTFFVAIQGDSESVSYSQRHFLTWTIGRQNAYIYDQENREQEIKRWTLNHASGPIASVVEWGGGGSGYRSTLYFQKREDLVAFKLFFD